jgi:cell division control protein 6
LVAGDQNTPRSIKKLGTPSHASTSIFNHARQLFARCSNPGKIIGRDAERAELAQFVQSRLQSRSGGCLYVSGPPGTGKSALLGDVISQWSKDESIKISVVNCMSVRTTKDLSQKLAEDLDLAEDADFDCIRSNFVQRGSRLSLVVLDEVDCLVDLDLALLYNLFEWALEPESSLVLIGIANALDLTDRLLPRLKTRNLKPDLLPFMPYTAAQISEVLTAKLKSLVGEESKSIPFLQPAAIQFCAKKVAAQTGDLRKAFDICQRAIDLVADEFRDRDEEKSIHDSPSKIPLMENCNLASPHSPQSPAKTKCAYTFETVPKATIAHIARVTAQAFGNGATQRLAGLNLQQKAVLCALAALEKRKRDTHVQKAMFSTPSKTGHSTAPTIKQLFETYSALCKREKLFHALSSLEFRDVVSGLEGLNLITPADGRSGSFGTPLTPSRTPSRRGKNSFAGPIATGDERRMASAVSKKEIECAIQGGPGGELLREMLEGDVML